MKGQKNKGERNKSRTTKHTQEKRKKKDNWCEEKHNEGIIKLTREREIE